MFKTLNESGEIKEFISFDDAYHHAKQNLDVWKIYFTINGELIRLVRMQDYHFMLQQMEDVVKVIKG